MINANTSNRPMKTVHKFSLAVISSILIFVIAYAAILHRYSAQGWLKYWNDDAVTSDYDAVFLQDFTSESLSVTQRYDALFSYFLRGFVDNATPNYERVNYPGAGSIRGFSVSGIEGFARTTPLFAAWIYSGRDPIYQSKYLDKKVDLISIIKQGLLAGTNPNSPQYWGDFIKFDQKTVEAVDISRVLWLTKAQIWDTLNQKEKDQIANWLQKAMTAKVPGNNWLLFPVVIGVTLESLGYTPAIQYTSFYEQFKLSYKGNGWFYDVPEGIDYYNAWGMTYDLFWINLIAPKFDTSFISKVIDESANLVTHLISPKGVPIMGRSVCYRTAIPAPIMIANYRDPQKMNNGVARRSLDVVWQYFIKNGALKNGRLTQGYLGDDLRLVDVYTGPGSCHWGTRSLVIAMLNPSDSHFWTDSESPLPVEREDFALSFPELGWTVTGKKQTSEIVIEIAANTKQSVAIEEITLYHKLKSLVFMRPFGPDNHVAKYEQRLYSSENPFPLQK